MFNPIEWLKIWGYSGSDNTWRPIQASSDGRIVTSKFNDTVHTRSLHYITLISPTAEYSLADAQPTITLNQVAELLIDNSYGAGDVRYAYSADEARTGTMPYRILPADGFERLIDAPMPTELYFQSAIANSTIVLEIVRKN